MYQVGEGVADGAGNERHARLEIQRLKQPQHEEQHCSTKTGSECSNTWIGRASCDRQGTTPLFECRSSRLFVYYKYAEDADRRGG